MEVGWCPYCNLYGMVTVVEFSSGGVETHGRCQACGYACDSVDVPGELWHDLPCEVCQPVEAEAAA